MTQVRSYTNGACLKRNGLGFDEYNSPDVGYLEDVFPVPDGVEEVEGLRRVPQGQHAVQGGALHVGLGQGGQAGRYLGRGGWRAATGLEVRQASLSSLKMHYILVTEAGSR